MRRSPQDSTPHFLFVLDKKKTGRGRSKRKNRHGGSVRACAYLHAAGEGWLAVLRSSFDKTRYPWGNLWAGVGPDTLRFSFRWRCLGGKRGPTRASAPTGCLRESGERTSYLPPRRGGCPHPPALPGFHQLLSKAQANLEGQTFRQPPRGLCQVGIRGARPTQLSSPARAGRRLSCLSRKRFRRPSYLSKPARMRRFCAKRSFLLDRARPVFFSARPKRKWGVESRSDHCTPRAAERHNTIFI